MPIHNLWLTNLATNSRGETLFFLPAFGYLILIMGTGLFLLNHWDRVKEVGFGDNRIVLPLVFLSASIALSSVMVDDWQEKIAIVGMGAILFAVYLMARILGKDIFLAFLPMVIIGVVSIVISGLVSPGQFTGGFITNYCASAGYIILGMLLVLARWKLIVFGLIGLFFTGAMEVFVIVGALGLAVIIRRDFGKPLYILAGCVIAVIGIWWALGYLVPLYTGNNNLYYLWAIVSGQTPINYESLQNLTTYRWDIYLRALSDIRLFGHGLYLSTVGGGIVHNIPLIIVHQIGPVGAVMWSFVTIYCLIKTRWKYAWVAVVATGLLDHYLWTQFTPLWWALVGVSTTSAIKSDFIFRAR